MGAFGLAGVSQQGGAGIDVEGLVNQLLCVDRAPVRLLQGQQRDFDARAAALRDINARLLDLQSKANALKDLSGKFNTLTATSSASGILSATASTSAQSGTHLIVVASLATTSSQYTNQLASGTTMFATGTFSLQIGAAAPTTIAVDIANNTLEGLASHINCLELGVRASVVTDSGGARLALVSQTSDAPGDLTISNNSTGLTFTKAVTGTNASLTVDGVPISSATNTISTVIPGVTLNLLAASPGTQVSLTVTPDTAKAREAIEEFVSSFNALAGAINSQFAFNPTTRRAGALAGDTSLRALQDRILADVRHSITGNNGLVNLATIGVGFQNDGTLSIDASKLTSVLESNFSDVKNLLQSTSPAGLAQNFSTDLDQLTDSVDGPLNVALNGISESQRTIADQIQDFEARLEFRRQRLTAEFSRVDAILRQLPLLLQQVNAQLSRLPQ